MGILAPLSPITTAEGKLRPKSGRKPLQPKNSPANIPIDDNLPNIKLKQQKPYINLNNDDRDKENRPMYATPVKIESLELDASLAEELSAVRKKLERLRLDRERTEKMLRERDFFFDKQMMELQKRGEAQKELEIEVDRLYRLKQLKLSCMRVSPIRSLREKQQDKKSSEMQPQCIQELKFDDLEESVDENVMPSPGSVSSKSTSDDKDTDPS